MEKIAIKLFTHGVIFFVQPCFRGQQIALADLGFQHRVLLPGGVEKLG